MLIEEVKELFDNDKMAAWLTEITKDHMMQNIFQDLISSLSKMKLLFKFRVTSKEEVESKEKKGKKRKKFIILNTHWDLTD